MQDDYHQFALSIDACTFTQQMNTNINNKKDKSTDSSANPHKLNDRSHTTSTLLMDQQNNKS